MLIDATNEPGDDDLKHLVEATYPYPIAASYRRLRMIDDADTGAKHDSYGDLCESLTKFLAIIALQDKWLLGQQPSSDMTNDKVYPLL